MVEHVVCDNPICVPAEGKPLDHLEGSTQAANLSRIAQHGRRGARGWKDERIARALASVDEAQTALF